jgi:hypothetical protein
VYKKTLLAALVGTGLGMNALAADIRDQWDIQISKAELVFPGTPPQDAANGIKDALSQFAIPANLSYRAMPSTPPARPGAPRLKQMSGAVPSPEYLCEDAYAEIYKSPHPSRTPLHLSPKAIKSASIALPRVSRPMWCTTASSAPSH